MWQLRRCIPDAIIFDLKDNQKREMLTLMHRSAGDFLSSWNVLGRDVGDFKCR